MLASIALPVIFFIHLLFGQFTGIIYHNHRLYPEFVTTSHALNFLQHLLWLLRRDKHLTPLGVREEK